MMTSAKAITPRVSRHLLPVRNHDYRGVGGADGVATRAAGRATAVFRSTRLLAPVQRRVRSRARGRGEAGLADALASVSRAGEDVVPQHGAPSSAPLPSGIVADVVSGLPLFVCQLREQSRTRPVEAHELRGFSQ